MAFTPIAEYMLRSTENRKSHLNLSSDCVEIGGGSQQFRGLLAHFLNTTLSTKRDAILCHACNNAKCSNVNHLYWGTYSENLQDSFDTGRKSIHFCLEEKYSKDEIREIKSAAGKAPRKRYGNRFSKPE
jgi:hypothetical protein